MPLNSAMVLKTTMAIAVAVVICWVHRTGGVRIQQAM